jgi:hypothetical protein
MSLIVESFTFENELFDPHGRPCCEIEDASKNTQTQHHVTNPDLGNTPKTLESRSLG